MEDIGKNLAEIWKNGSFRSLDNDDKKHLREQIKGIFGKDFDWDTLQFPIKLVDGSQYVKCGNMIVKTISRPVECVDENKKLDPWRNLLFVNSKFVDSKQKGEKENEAEKAKKTEVKIRGVNEEEELKRIFEGVLRVGKSKIQTYKGLTDFIKEFFIDNTQNAYGGYALFKFLDDNKYLVRDCKMTMFVETMKKVYGKEFKGGRSEMSRYSFLDNYDVEKWQGDNERIIKAIETINAARKKENEEGDEGKKCHKVNPKAVEKLRKIYNTLKEAHDAL